MKILLVCETHTILHQHVNPEDKFKILRTLDCYKYGEFFELDMQDYNIEMKSIFLGDSKPYWRSYLQPTYKANRPKRSLAFPTALQLKGYQDTVVLTSFEADDIAGLIWRMWPKLRYEFDYLAFSTIDSDWLQLATASDIFIVDQKGYLPPFRSAVSSWLWVKNQLKSKYQTKKNKIELEAIIESLDSTQPDYWSSVIRTFKHHCGDKVDNIPPMAPEYMTNILMRPPSPFGEELDLYQPVIQKLIDNQEFRPAKYCMDYLTDCIIEDHCRVPLLDKRNWEEMGMKKAERPNLLSFMT